MEAVVECVKGTYEKIEKVVDKNGDISFNVDRLLKHRWVSSYGYIPNTLQVDGDELDTYIIGKHLETGLIVDVLPICLVYCVDNGEVDNKLICAARTAGKNLKWAIRRIVRYIGKYKKNSYPVAVTWKESNIRYELAKCKAFYELFKK